MLSAGIYLLSMLKYLSKSGKVSNCYGKHIFLPLVFILVLFVSNALHAVGNQKVFPSTIFLNWILFFFILLHSIYNRSITKVALYGMAVGTVILAVLFYLGIGVEVNITREGDRFSMFGSNENDLAIIQSIGLTIILNYFILKDSLHLKFLRYGFFFPMLLQITMIVATGSRSSFLTLVVVVALSLLTLQTKKKYTYYVLVFCGISVLIYAIQVFLTEDNAMVARLSNSITEGDTGGRVDIWKTYLKYVPENLLLGVGNTGMMDVALQSGVGTTEVMGKITAYSPHNVLVEVLLTSGLVGFIPMLLFWIVCLAKSIKAFTKYNLALPMLMFIPILVILMSGQLLNEKYAWLIYAYIIVSYTYESKAKSRSMAFNRYN